jgi:hypothetical protein
MSKAGQPASRPMAGILDRHQRPQGASRKRHNYKNIKPDGSFVVQALVAVPSQTSDDPSTGMVSGLLPTPEAFAALVGWVEWVLARRSGFPERNETQHSRSIPNQNLAAPPAYVGFRCNHPVLYILPVPAQPNLQPANSPSSASCWEALFLNHLLCIPFSIPDMAPLGNSPRDGFGLSLQME